jgi:hypothetical protein
MAGFRAPRIPTWSTHDMETAVRTRKACDARAQLFFFGRYRSVMVPS